MLPVLIIGAGISGLTFAHALRKHNVPFYLFERDPSLDARLQGYRVRVSEPGINALSQCLEAHDFKKLTQCCAKVTNVNMTPVARLDAITADDFPASNVPQFSAGGSSTHAGVKEVVVKPLNVDRGVTRKVLYSGLEEHIKFGKTYSSYEETADGVTIFFKDGSSIQGSLLVGADGTWSKVRKQLLPSYQLRDTGHRLIFGKTTLTEKLTTNFNAKALAGLSIIMDRTNEKDRVGLLSEPMEFYDNEYRPNLPDNYLYWVLLLHKNHIKINSTNDDDQDDKAFLSSTPDQIAALAEKAISHWDPSFHPLFTNQSPGQTSVLRIVSAHPDIPFWQPGRVTLIGDAIHAMPPTGAAGATTALRDAGTLAKYLLGTEVEGHTKLDDVAAKIGSYEREMRQYAGEAIRTSFFGGKLFYGMKDVDDCDVVEMV